MSVAHSLFLNLENRIPTIGEDTPWEKYAKTFERRERTNRGRRCGESPGQETVRCVANKNLKGNINEEI